MITVLIPLLVAVWQQQRPRPAPPPATVVPIQSGSSEPRTPFDTTRATLIEIARRVADLKSSLDMYRRAAFNEPDGALLENAGMFARDCRALAEAAEHGRRTLCRHCLAPSAQGPVDEYRAYLPTLARVGRQCAARVEQLRSGRSAQAAAAGLRRDVLPANNRVVDGLRPYEARLQQVRIAFGWAMPPTPAPRR
jgi:hypothetical protein